MRPQEFVSLWRGVSDADTQRMALLWESQELLALNRSIMAFIKDQACTLSVPAPCCKPCDHTLQVQASSTGSCNEEHISEKLRKRIACVL